MSEIRTNVVSEAMKPEPQPAVRAWLDCQVAETLYLSSVTVAELLFEIAAIAVSRGFIAASRDTAPYTAADVNVINPRETSGMNCFCMSNRSALI